MTFCQSAENHATVAAGSSVAATEIDSNKYRERKRKRGRIGRKEGEEEEKTAKGERKTKEKGEEGWGGGERREQDRNSRRHGMSGDEPGLDVDCQHR